MRCKAKGCQQSAEIDTLCLPHYVVTNGVTIVDAILERNRRQAAINESQDEIVVKAQANDFERRKAAFIQRSIQHNHGHDICMCGQPHSSHGDYAGCMTTWGYLAGNPNTTKAAANPKCEIEDCMRDAERGNRRCEDHKDPDDRCTESGCTNMVIPHGPGYGYGLCRDHFYERKHDAAVTLWPRIKRLDLLTTVVGAVPFVGGSILSIGAMYGVATDQLDLAVLCGFMFCLCVGAFWSEFGLSRDWKWKRADRPRIPSKNAAKPQPFSLPNV